MQIFNPFTMGSVFNSYQTYIQPQNYSNNIFVQNAYRQQQNYMAQNNVPTISNPYAQPTISATNTTPVK